MSQTAKMTDRQVGRPSNLSPSLPALRDALLDRTMLAATLRHCFDSDTLRDTLTIAYEDAEPRQVLSDDEAHLCCQLEKLGFDQVSAERLQQALALLPHTPEHEAQRSNWVQP